MFEIVNPHIEDIIFDDGEKIEIECSYPDMEAAIQALHDDPRYDN